MSYRPDNEDAGSASDSSSDDAKKKEELIMKIAKTVLDFALAGISLSDRIKIYLTKEVLFLAAKSTISAHSFANSLTQDFSEKCKELGNKSWQIILESVHRIAKGCNKIINCLKSWWRKFKDFAKLAKEECGIIFTELWSELKDSAAEYYKNCKASLLKFFKEIWVHIKDCALSCCQGVKAIVIEWVVEKTLKKIYSFLPAGLKNWLSKKAEKVYEWVSYAAQKYPEWKDKTIGYVKEGFDKGKEKAVEFVNIGFDYVKENVPKFTRKIIDCVRNISVKTVKAQIDYCKDYCVSEVTNAIKIAEDYVQKSIVTPVKNKVKSLIRKVFSWFW